MFSVIIPAFNEEERLPLTLWDIAAYLEAKAIDYEILVVSDGSQDKTEAIVQSQAAKNHRIKLLVNQENQGKGYSVRKGVLAASGDPILFMDADNSTRISELEKLLPYLDGCDVVVGSRALAGSAIIKRQAWFREAFGKLFNAVVQLFFLPGLKDTQCGFKLFQRKAALDIFQRAKTNRFAFDVEVLYLAKKLGYKIAEVPIAWANSKPSRVSFFRDFLNIIFDLLKIRLEFGY